MPEILPRGAPEVEVIPPVKSGKLPYDLTGLRHQTSPKINYQANSITQT